MKKTINVQDKLALTLRFLASGESYTSLQYLFKISKQVISNIVPEVCQALIEVLQENIKVRICIFIHFFIIKLYNVFYIYYMSYTHTHWCYFTIYYILY